MGGWLQFLWTASPWLILVGWLAFAAKWRWALALNGLAILVVGYIWYEAERLAANENTDQAGVGAMILLGLLIVIVLAGIVVTALAGALGALWRRTRDTA